jgi:uncharacterized protein (DUF488 family)
MLYPIELRAQVWNHERLPTFSVVAKIVGVDVRRPQAGDMAIRTLGHGTLDADGFAALVDGAGISEVVDVRRYPGSRRLPHFGGDAMAGWLSDHGIAYRWLPSLGGRRTLTPGSPNVGLRNEQFRAYADHMESAEFGEGVAELLELAAGHDVAVMCSESVWWRCHRRLVADHLVLLDGTEVEHLFHDGRLQPHPPTPEARVDGDRLVYDLGHQATLLEP